MKAGTGLGWHDCSVVDGQPHDFLSKDICAVQHIRIFRDHQAGYADTCVSQLGEAIFRNAIGMQVKDSLDLT